MSDNKKGANNPMFGSLGEKSPRFGKKLSEETLNKLRTKIHSNLTKEKISKTLGFTIEVTNIVTGITTVYDSIGKAAVAIDSSRTTISRYIRSGKLFKDIYKIMYKPK